MWFSGRRVVRPSAFALVLAAVLAPVLYTAYLTAIGYQFSLGFPPSVVYVLPLAALGPAVLAARCHDLRASVALVAVGLPAYPWVRLFGPRPSAGGDAFAFAADVLLAFVTFAVLAAGEYAIRNRLQLRRSLSARTVGIAAFAGVTHFFAFVLVRNVLTGAAWGRPNPFIAALWAWLFVGLVLSAGIPVALAAEFRLLTPVTVVSVAFAWAAFETLSALPRTGIAPGTMSMYGLAWFVPLAVALAAAGAEWLLRKRFGVGPRSRCGPRDSGR